MNYRKKQPIDKTCAYCGVVYQSTHGRSKYCSSSCNTMACYERKGYVYRSGRYIKPERNLPAPLAEKPVALAVKREEVKETPTVSNVSAVAVTALGGLTANAVAEVIKGLGYQSQDVKAIVNALEPLIRTSIINQHELGRRLERIERHLVEQKSEWQPLL